MKFRNCSPIVKFICLNWTTHSCCMQCRWPAGVGDMMTAVVGPKIRVTRLSFWNLARLNGLLRNQRSPSTTSWCVWLCISICLSVTCLRAPCKTQMEPVEIFVTWPIMCLFDRPVNRRYSCLPAVALLSWQTWNAAVYIKTVRIVFISIHKWIMMAKCYKVFATEILRLGFWFPYRFDTAFTK